MPKPTMPVSTPQTPIPWGALNLSTPGAVSPATDAKSQFIKTAAQKAPAPALPSTNPNTAFNTMGGTPTAPTIQYNYNNGIATPAGAPAAAPTTPTTPTTSAADEAFATYIKSLSASPEQTAANDYLNKLVTQAASDQEKALASGETTGFATGEAARVGRQNNIAIDAASRALSTFQTRDTNLSTANKARADYEKNKMDAATTKAAAESAGARADQSNKPSIVQEYEYAKKNGYTGSFTQYQNEDANRKNPAPPKTSTAKPTAAENKASGFQVINQLLVPGMKIKGTNGIPYLDNEGYLTPEGLDKLIAAAQSDGIARKDFLDEFGVFIGATNKFQNYNLTAAEKKRLLGV